MITSAVDLQPVFIARATDPMLPDWYRIQRVQRENHDTFTLELPAQADTSREVSPAPLGPSAP